METPPIHKGLGGSSAETMRRISVMSEDSIDWYGSSWCGQYRETFQTTPTSRYGVFLR
jgi:hypothetical protein